MGILFRWFIVVVFLCGACPVWGLGTIALNLPAVGVKALIGDDNGVLINPSVAISNAVNWGGGTLTYTIELVSNSNVYDTLTCTPTNVAITSAYNSGTRTLTITAASGVPFADIQTACQSVRFFCSGGLVNATRNIQLLVQENSKYYATTGHYYMSSQTLGAASVAASAASANAATFTHYGLKGYLVTIANAGENTFVTGVTSGQTTIGTWWVPDAPTGTKKYRSGPESGATDTYTNSGGVDRSGIYFYTNWGGGGPGVWDDTGDITGPYAVEFGGLGTDSTYIIPVRMSAMNSILMGTML